MQNDLDKTSLTNLLHQADARHPAPAPDPRAIAHGAMQRVSARRRQRRIAAVLIPCLAIAAIAPLFFHTLPPQHIPLTQTTERTQDLDARADQVIRELAALRLASATADTTPQPRQQIIQGLVDEARDRAAFVLVHSTDRYRTVPNASDLVASAYRQAAAAFPETPSAQTARDRLEKTAQRIVN